MKRHHGAGSLPRHQMAMRGEIPEQYVQQAQEEGDPDSGRQLYAQNCTACHGDSGRGDGPAGAALDPKPANLTHFSGMGAGQSRALVTWAISEGGQAFGSAMPAFKETLSPPEIQDLVAYIHQGARADHRIHH